MNNITHGDMIRCILREIKLRTRNYPKYVAAGTMSSGQTAKELELINAVLAQLRRDQAIAKVLDDIQLKLGISKEELEEMILDAQAEIELSRRKS